MKNKNSESPAAVLDAAEIDERNKLAAHDVARARLRAARSAYRKVMRVALIDRDPPVLPDELSDATATIIAAVAAVIAANELFDGLTGLDETDRALIDASVASEAARLDLDDLLEAFGDREECHHE